MTPIVSPLTILTVLPVRAETHRGQCTAAMNRMIRGSPPVTRRVSFLCSPAIGSEP